MILQALVDYYEQLAAQGRITKPGWAKVKVSWALEIDENGQLLDVLPLRTPSSDGKKMLPREMELPTPGYRQTSCGTIHHMFWAWTARERKSVRQNVTRQRAACIKNCSRALRVLLPERSRHFSKPGIRCMPGM